MESILGEEYKIVFHIPSQPKMYKLEKIMNRNYDDKF